MCWKAYKNRTLIAQNGGHPKQPKYEIETGNLLVNLLQADIIPKNNLKISSVSSLRYMYAFNLWSTILKMCSYPALGSNQNALILA